MPKASSMPTSSQATSRFHFDSQRHNHNREDGMATKVGCDIYFVTDHLIESEEGLDVSECKHGTMAEFADWCEALPSLK